MNSKRIGIIGIEGKYGQRLQSFFEESGHTVVGSDLKSSDDETIVERDQDIVTQSEVVVFAVPIKDAPRIIREVSPVSRKEQLWLDITSLKRNTMRAMSESKAEYVGLHPMCGPSVSWRGQTVIMVCPEKISDQWNNWLDQMLEESQANVEKLVGSQAAETHDGLMAFIQGLPHAGNLIMASALRDINANVGESLKYTSPPYRFLWTIMARILSGEPELYADLQIENQRNTLEIVRKIEKAASKFRKIIEDGDRDAFLSEFRASRDHFGESNLRGGYNLFDRLAHVLADLSDENLVELQTRQDRIGLMYEITEIFKNYQINLTSLHSFRSGDRYIFIIGMEQRRDSPEVVEALQKIESDVSAVEVISNQS
jgi:prephenate dehydrogenase